MRLKFVNRESELRELDAAAARGGVLVLYGRRRIGKTRLLRHWLGEREGLYSQAIEAPSDLQLRQVFDDIGPRLETRLTPKSWEELLEILALQKRRWVFCLDEFPYLAATDATLPSRIQKWVDHSLPEGCLLILSGSSTRMMHDLFLNPGAALYGRADKLINLRPMEFAAFCKACGEDPALPEVFEKFACVGGVPKYWEFVERDRDAVALAETLYFDFAPYMEQEPHRILRDEGVAGLNAVAVLEAVGRGAERPSEIAARLGTAQTNLSRLLQQLLDASILIRELPFGESARSTKKVLYRIADPTMRFWFRVYSPHRSLWATYALETKRKLIHDHAASVFEDFCRARYPGAARYWEPGIELDVVAPDPEEPGRLLVAEVKWRQLTETEREGIRDRLKETYSRSSLRDRPARFEVLDAGFAAR